MTRRPDPVSAAAAEAEAKAAAALAKLDQLEANLAQIKAEMKERLHLLEEKMAWARGGSPGA